MDAPDSREGRESVFTLTMIDRLIVYLRGTLAASQTESVPLGGEFAQLRAYLEIMSLRMGPRLTFRLELPAALEDSPVPPMLLQPLVENAIKHGLEPKPGGGTIWILARGFDDHVTVTVADDGLGFGQGTSGTGIGLKNLRERLRLTCGEQAGVAIVANFPSGVAATMTLPQSSKERSPVVEKFETRSAIYETSVVTTFSGEGCRCTRRCPYFPTARLHPSCASAATYG